MKKLNVLDTTLRDGAQSAQVNFSQSDKIAILGILDDLGFGFAEAGSPGIFQDDRELFEHLKKDRRTSTVRIVAFAPTRRPGITAGSDPVLTATADAALDYVSLFGKADIMQVTGVLETTADENLSMIRDSVSYMKKRGKRVIFEAEHFFDGYLRDPAYAVSTVSEAVSAGAERIVLCDTNGGMLPEQISSAVKALRKLISLPIGIHCHNDSGLAVANTLAACHSGAEDIHGTMCGLGERCGNTNLCTAIPDLQLKLGYSVIPKEKLAMLSYYARKIADISNISFSERDPYVGRYAFTHKAGTHIDAELKCPEAFEHVNPESVGNRSVYLVSNQSGRASAAERLKLFDPSVTKNSPCVSKFLSLIKEKESEGYQLENADGSVVLMILGILGKRREYFKLLDFKIVLGNPIIKECPTSVLLKIDVGGQSALVADEGIGPVNAIDNALRKGLCGFYPILTEMKLSDYRVRVIDSKAATAAKVMVSIESRDRTSSWRTVGVSTDIIEASWIALCESLEYKLSLADGLIQ